MSAQPCGCDREAAWMCKRHLEESVSGAKALMDTLKDAPSTDVIRFKQRLADEHTMRDTIADVREPQREINRLNSAHLEQIERSWPSVDTPAVRMVNAAVDLLAERKRIAAVLATFYRAELSMSSVHPLLALALELNPDLVERKR